MNSDRFRNWCLEHIARPRPAQSFVPQIDGLRFVAIAAVVLFHVQGYVIDKAGVADAGWIYRFFAKGYFGVPLFFALSGYIIARQFFGQEQVRLGRYFLRRLTRLEPPYVISVCLVFTVKLWLLDVTFPELLPHVLASLVYFHNLVFAAQSTVNGVAWSLEIEWQFYVLAPLAFALVLRAPVWIRHAGLWLFILLGGLAYIAARGIGPRFELSLLGFFGYFAAGTWVALVDPADTLPRASSWFDLCGTAAAAGILYVLSGGVQQQILLPALTAILVLSALRGPLLKRALGWWPIYTIGAMCYTIYLYHFFVVSAAGTLFGRLVGWFDSSTISLLLFALLALPLVLVVCLVPYLLFERPFMVWRPGTNRLRDAFRLHPA